MRLQKYITEAKQPKKGEVLAIGTLKKAKTIDTFTDDMNISYQLFQDTESDKAMTRVFDNDGKETIDLTIYPNFEMAKKKYQSTIKLIKRGMK